jgi:hypothetical protein
MLIRLIPAPLLENSLCVHLSSTPTSHTCLTLKQTVLIKTEDWDDGRFFSGVHHKVEAREVLNQNCLRLICLKFCCFLNLLAELNTLNTYTFEENTFGQEKRRQQAAL